MQLNIYIYTSIIGLRFHVSSLDGPNYCLWIVRVVCVILTCLDGKNPQVFNVRSTRFMVKSTCLDSKVTMLDMLDGKIGMWTFPKMGVTPRSSKSLDSLDHDFVLKQPWWLEDFHLRTLITITMSLSTMNHWGTLNNHVRMLKITINI